ncbi:HD-GYP domain-containing protein [Thermohalobacter berrensis]|uniref:HD-GYP domain-containing protein n=1 Tax=Thermohalobacter berrensis TaxID=99594 RepID=A0A419T0C5_9FIRM|nr:HD-GYP domain-containing protein [Thermohalobacter berrensis]RKD30881.1 hypothetical protein BET03_13235 [Thermohalobacter berrensis]
MAKISLNQVKPGMVIMKDIISKKNGLMILAAGNALNEKYINYLKQQGIKQVDVVAKDTNNKKEVPAKDENFIEKYNSLHSKTKKILKNLKVGKKIVIKEVSDVVDDMMDELMKINNIFGKLNQLKENNDFIYDHCVVVSMLATMVGKWLNYSKSELKQLAYAGLFHDIGKMKISEAILNKRGFLTEEESKFIKKHPIYGYNILSETVGISKKVALGVLQHHERENGSGYPLGVTSEKIHEFAKIIAICDIFHNKIYKNKECPFTVAEYINTKSFEVLDPRISKVFLDNIAKFYVGNTVKLNDGKVGKIVLVHKDIPTRPIIKVGEKFINLKEEKKYKIVNILD